MAKLSDRQKNNIIAKFKTGTYTNIQLAKAYKVSEKTIRNIIKTHKYKDDFVYIITCDKYLEDNIIKVGVSNNPKKRLKTFQTSCPYELYIASLFKTDKAYDVEKQVHWLLDCFRISGEWFKINPDKLESILKECEITNGNK